MSQDNPAQWNSNDDSPMGKPILGDRGGIGSMGLQEQKDAHAQAIHAAKRKVLEKARQWCDVNFEDPYNVPPKTKENFELSEAVNELDRLTAPAAVDPQTLKPGDRFRFADGVRQTPQDTVRPVKTIKIYLPEAIGDDWILGWLGDDSGAYQFAKRDRVIPVEPEQ